MRGLILPQLYAPKRGGLAPPTDLASYSQAWSLIDFIAGSKNLRRKTGKFVLKLKDTGAEGIKIETTDDLQKALEAQQKAFLKLQTDALKEVFGLTLPQFEALWKRYVLARY